MRKKWVSDRWVEWGGDNERGTHRTPVNEKRKIFFWRAYLEEISQW